jgi:phage gpG-like protein
VEVKFDWSWNYKGKSGKETFFHTSIGSFEAGLRDWSPAFQDMVTDVLEPAVSEQFTTQGHGTWAELAPSTVARKGHSIILQESGRLEHSFHRGGADHVEMISRTRLTWGSSVPYGLFHQTGTGSGFQRRAKGAGRGVPMRKILELTDTNKRAMRSRMVRHLATLARRTGFAIIGGSDPLAARAVGRSWVGA